MAGFEVATHGRFWVATEDKRFRQGWRPWVSLFNRGNMKA